MILPAMILQMMAVGLRKRGRLRLCYSSLNNADAQLLNYTTHAEYHNADSGTVILEAAV